MAYELQVDVDVDIPEVVVSNRDVRGNPRKRRFPPHVEIQEHIQAEDIEPRTFEIDDVFPPTTTCEYTVPRKRRVPSPVVIEEITIEEPFVDDTISDQESETHSLSSESSSHSQASTTSSSSHHSSSSPSSLPTESLDNDDPFEILFDNSEINLESDINSPNSPPLFTGSSLNVLCTLAVLFSWFTSFPGISKQGFNRLLHILHHFILPAGNALPATYAAALKIIQPYLIPVREFDCCPNDCILYRGSDEHKTHCPVCGEERYLDNISRKKFKYLPLLPRIKRFFKNKKMSELLQNHANSLQSTSAVHDIHQTQTWKEWFSQGGIFKGDPRGIALAFCADGTNPFSKEKSNYSMWPITLSFLNLSSALRRSADFLQLVGIIPGKNEPKSTDAYLQVFMDELRDINGTKVYDSYQDNWFELRIHLLMHVLDYPGQNKVFHCHGAGAYSGCCYCQTKGEHSESLNKIVYLDHRRFLPLDHPLRKERTGFPTTKRPKPLPKPKDMPFIKNTISRLEKARSKTNVIRDTGFKGGYSLLQLAHHDRYLNTPAEPMHLIKNIVEHIVRLISGFEDSIKVRNEEKARGRFSEAHVSSKTSKLPPAPFRLTVTEAKLADERLVSVQVPSGFGWKPKALFNTKKAQGMKSHSWKQLVSTNILIYCMRGLLGQKQRQTLFFFCGVLAQLCAESLNLSHMEQLELDVHYGLSLLERDFPVSMHVIVFHLLHHLPFYLARFGPCWAFWMYPYERFNSWVIRRVLNRRYPEATVIATYRLFEWAIFLQKAGELPESAILPLHDDNDDDTSSNESKCTHYSLSPVEFSNLQFFYSPDIRSLLSTEVSKMHKHTYTDIHGRTVTLTSSTSDTKSIVSSYVYTELPNKSLVFGRILFFFTLTFTVDTHAYVHWFEKPTRESESGLLYVYLTSFSSLNPVVLVCNLSRPLVTAVDINNDNKLWILTVTNSSMS